MDITKRIPYFVRISNLKKEYKILSNKSLNRPEFYFSDHAFQRMAERDLHRDLPFVFCAVKYFMAEVFDKQTYSLRQYRINYKGLVIGISIEPGRNSRRVVLKTVFDHPVDFYNDETITLR